MPNDVNSCGRVVPMAHCPSTGKAWNTGFPVTMMWSPMPMPSHPSASRVAAQATGSTAG